MKRIGSRDSEGEIIRVYLWKLFVNVLVIQIVHCSDESTIERKRRLKNGSLYR